jgi:hypothetical protein
MPGTRLDVSSIAANGKVIKVELLNPPLIQKTWTCNPGCLSSTQPQIIKIRAVFAEEPKKRALFRI